MKLQFAIFTGALLASTLVLGAPPVASPTHEEHAVTAHGQTGSAELAVEAGSIRLSAQKADSDDVAGSVWSKSGAMSFRTLSTTHDKATARGSKPDRVEATLEVNGIAIKHVFDSLQNNVVISTPESVKLEKADVEVLKTFQQEFAKSRLTAENFASMPRATEVVWRLSEMYSEAPYGVSLPKLRVVAFDRDPEQNADIDGLFGIGSAAKACGASGGGFIDLHDQGNVCDKGHLWRSEAHDYCTGPGANHTMKTVAHQDFGCATNGCYGRCGGGCGVLNGQGAWQKDCLDHDVCNRTHGQQFSGCGDEWNEAADDYLNGEIHCIFDHC